jgi:hypothetical protein
MPTSLADLLDALDHAATRLPDHPVSRADAGAALGHLGRALTHLKIDGISATVGDERERRVATIGVLCTGLAARAPISEGRVAALAAAAADTIAVLRDETTVPARWAITVEIIDAVATVADVIERGSGPTPAAEWTQEIQTQALWIHREAARHPPCQRDGIVLDRALPEPGGLQRLDAGTAIAAATAALVHATRTTAPPLPIAAVLAVATACETVSTAAQRLQLSDTDPVAPELYASGRGSAASGEVAGAAQAWQSIRASLQPFHDTSTRTLRAATRLDMGTAPTPAVGSVITVARCLHEQLMHLANYPKAPNPATVDAIASAAQHLPVIARAIEQNVTSWYDNATVMSFACDLPLRETRFAQRFAGYRFDGMVHADRFDLVPVLAAARNADLLGSVLAADVDRATNSQRVLREKRPAVTSPIAAGVAIDPVLSPTRTASKSASGTRHLAAAHQSDIDAPDASARVLAAQHTTYAQLQQAQRTTGHRRSR